MLKFVAGISIFCQEMLKSRQGFLWRSLGFFGSRPGFFQCNQGIFGRSGELFPCSGGILGSGKGFFGCKSVKGAGRQGFGGGSDKTLRREAVRWRSRGESGQ
jgi:hypothetical protein